MSAWLTFGLPGRWGDDGTVSGEPRFRLITAVACGGAFLFVSGVPAGGVPVLAQQVFCDGLEATIVGTPGSEVIPELPVTTSSPGAGDDEVNAGGGNDRICAGEGADLIRGEDGNDRIFSESGDDLLVGGPGADALEGGPDTDRIDFTTAVSAVTVSLTAGLATGEATDASSVSKTSLALPTTTPSRATTGPTCWMEGQAPTGSSPERATTRWWAGAATMPSTARMVSTGPTSPGHRLR